MRKIILSILVSLFVLFSFSQNQTTTNDIMQKHSGDSLSVKVIKVDQTTITFKYPGEDAEQTIGKFAVSTIIYGSSGRVEKISDKIEIRGDEDWEKVEIVTDKAQVWGLKKGEEVIGQTAPFFSNHLFVNSADKKATSKIKKAAAALKAPFVLITSDRVTSFDNIQSIKNGATYSYK